MDVTTQIPAARDSSRDLPFFRLFEAAAIGIGICDFEGCLLEANPALAGMLGFDRKELAGHEPWGFHDAEVESADSAQSHGNVRRLLAELLRGQCDSFGIDKRFRRKEGSDFRGGGTSPYHSPATLAASRHFWSRYSRTPPSGNG